MTAVKLGITVDRTPLPGRLTRSVGVDERPVIVINGRRYLVRELGGKIELTRLKESRQ